MAQKRVLVGTSPVLLANGHLNRRNISVSMPPSAVESANTGVVYIGKGFTPSAVAGNPNTGDPLSQGSQFADSEQFDGDPSVFKGQLWAIADTAAQVIIVDETLS